jgi:hypothetical protein
MSDEQKPRYWRGTKPDKCQLCGQAIVDEFADAHVPGGTSWAIICPDKKHGASFGTGLGQRYEKQEDDRWLKVEG